MRYPLPFDSGRHASPRRDRRTLSTMARIGGLAVAAMVAIALVGPDAGATATEIEDRTRTIYEASWDRRGEEWVFRIRGNGFLQYMVRTITGTLLDIGQDRLRPDQVTEIFAARDRRLAGPSLPPHGLHLMRVEY